MPIPAWNATPHRLFLLLLVQLILLSCQRTPPVLPVAPTTRPPTLTLGPRTENLLHPRRIDWATQQISAPSLVAQRQSWLKQLADERDQSSYRLQAWPDPAASWTVSGNSYPGITLSALSNVATLSGVALGSNDIVTNGAASTLVASNDPNELHNRVFFLTKEGRLLKLKRDNPLDTPRGLNLNKTFSSTYVSLSPRCSRAYLLADDGTFFVVDTRGATMTVQCSTDIGGGGSTSEGEGIAPTLDPIVSNDADHQDIVYVPRNDGHVFKYTITPTTSSLSGTDYTVATATAIVDSTYNPSGHKIFSPCVVLDGKIMLGDGAGYFHYFNTSTSTDKTYAISTRGILTPPAIEIQDGSYTGLTDANGNSTTVATNAPLYAFVNVTRKNGPVCAWINLASDDVWYSRPLYLDDHDTTDRYGAWFAYDYSASDTDRIMTADDSLNAASDYATNLPGATQTYSSDHLSPALGNVNLNTTPVTSFSVSPAPEDVVVDKDGKIWVSHPSTNQVKRYSKTGTLENTYSVTSQPEGIAYDRTNNYIWVSNANDAANADGTQDVHRINVNTNATAVFDVAYKKPNDVAVGPDGSVWVSADTGTQIAKLDSNGTKLANYEIGFTHKGVAVDPSGNAVWVTVSDAGTVQLARIDVASGTVKTFNNSNANGTNYSPGSAPTAIDVTSQGSIWVAYPSANTLKHYSWPGGNALTTLATITATGCKGIVVDNSDGVWVTCSNNTVQRILNNAISGSVTVGNDARGIDIGPFGLACANAGSSTISIFGSSNSTGVQSFLRFNDTTYTTVASGATLISATLKLQTNTRSTSCYPPEVYSLGRQTGSGSTGVYKKGTTTLWSSSSGLTASEAPLFNLPMGYLPGSSANGNTTSTFASDTSYQLDVTRGMVQNVPFQHVAFALRYTTGTTGTSEVYWRNGPLPANASSSTLPLYAPQFQSHSYTTDTTKKPTLTLTYKVKNDPPTYPMGTSPLIDVSGSRKRVYVFNANTLFSLDFTSPKTWTDTDYSPGQSTAGTKYSRFNEGSLGRAGSAGGTMTDTKTRYLRNTITPVLNFDLSALYAVCYYPDTGVYNDTLFKVAVNKFTLPINESTSADRLSASAPSTTTSDAIATGTTAIAAENSVHNGNSVSANVGNRLLSIDPLATNGANDGIYLGLAGTKALYRFQL